MNKFRVIEDEFDASRQANNIWLSIQNPTAPIVFFFGPPYSGKTVALFRMTRFLESQNYRVNPISSFRPNATDYIRMCSEFKNMVYSYYAPPRYSMLLNFILVSVHNPVGQTICQILKVPGVHCFDPSYKSNIAIPTYFNTFISCPNKKVWVFFLEQGWRNNQAVRDLYAHKICCMQELISPNDKVVFLFNKADLHLDQYDRTGKPRKELFFNKIKHEYPNIFTRYKNNGLKKLIYGEYDIKAVCFSSGIFTTLQDEKVAWGLSDDLYCSQFWNAIQKSIK